MARFWDKNHNKYLILGHKLLADVQGWLPQRLRNELIWNRTANLQGKKGHNIALDLVNEFLNKDFKENLKSGKGHYNIKNVERASQLVGTLGKDLDKVYQSQVAGTYAKKQAGSKKNYHQDIYKFVEEYIDDRLFEIIPGREHSAYTEFHFAQRIKNPNQLRNRLKKYSRKLDRLRNILP